jgi:putative DNA primase/helicase
MKYYSPFSSGAEVPPAERSSFTADFAAAKSLDKGVVTQDGVALVFASRFEDALRFCHDTGAWFEWCGSHWRRDTTKRALQYARELARENARDCKRSDLKDIKRLTFASGVEQFARADPVFAVTADAWDPDPLLLGTPKGTVDLRTGDLRPSRPADGITRITSVAPAAEAECPLWLTFLEEATGGDQDMVRFLQRWCGYGLTGDTREHALAFVYGPGGNGKSVFLNTIGGIMGDYAVSAPMDTFTAARGDRHPTEIAMLRGARLVTASETEEGRAWAEARIKQLTGGERAIQARFMRQDFFEFRPQFKLTIVGNHKPVLRNVDDAARRRFNIVPFTRKPASPDPQLEAKLKREWPGILRWMIDGCLDWQQDGLRQAEAVRAATEAYFEDQDVIAQWLAEECDAEPGNAFKWESTGKLFEAWAAYALAAGESPGSKKAFSAEMVRRGFEPHRLDRARGFRGIRLQRHPSLADDG